jgi:putative membrane protein
MIVRPRPHPLQLLYIIRGSIVRQVAARILVITALSCLVVALVRMHVISPLNAGAIPFSIMAIALSVFLGFRNNTSYDRWWEARKQWGELIVQTRAFARECLAAFADTPTTHRQIRRTIGFAHALAAHLRGQDSSVATRPWLPATEQVGGGRTNIPDTVLHLINQELAASLRRGDISDILYQGLVQRLLAMTAVQTACERIRNTPPPFAYSLLLHRTAWLFCLLLPLGLAGSLGLMTPLAVAIIAYTFFGLDELGDELEEPFSLADNGLPLNAMVRTIEIDLLAGLGVTPLPAPLEAEEFVLL